MEHKIQYILNITTNNNTLTNNLAFYERTSGKYTYEENTISKQVLSIKKLFKLNNNTKYVQCCFNLITCYRIII